MESSLRWPPINKKDLANLQLSSVDVVLITGDAYVDHPSFGSAIITRFLESLGLTVGVVPQPNWKDDLRDFKKLGVPNLFFAVTSGNMDSMVNHYTGNKRLRSNDAYTPGERAGFRPDYAVNVYTKILKQLYPDSNVVIGGIEASLRRSTHYDYWSNSLMPSILQSSGADLLVYGGGEKPLGELVKLLQRGVPFKTINTIKQTSVLINDCDLSENKKWETLALNSHEDCLEDKKKFAENFVIIETESNKLSGARLLQKTGEKIVVINPPYPPLTTQEIDSYYDLDFFRIPHPRYKGKGRIPAYDMIKGSVNTHRGCFGGCSFCSISVHQGKFVSSRSKGSIVEEVKKISKVDGFDGVISDLGGPSANMYMMEGKILAVCEKCSRFSCIYPKVCKNLNIDHSHILELFKAVEQLSNIKHLFTTSGIRYDLILEERIGESSSQEEYLKKMVNDHTSGRFKVAPEHCDEEVLRLMRKPSFEQFKKIKKLFDKIARVNASGKRREITPYFISAHPGCGLKEMEHLAKETKSLGYKLEQIQDFTPTPMTLSSVMYYTGIDPYSGEAVYVASKTNERAEQRRYFFWYLPENSDIRKKLD